MAYFCYDDTASISGSAPPGYYSSLCWEEQSIKPSPVTAGTLMMVKFRKWRQIEPQRGVYDWAALDTNITKAASLDLQLVLAVEICKADPADEATPDWLYDEVPGVNFTHVPKGTVPPPNTTNPHRCPYYLDVHFQDVFGSLINAVAAHVSSLPEKETVVAVQAMLGITGDDRPWNGVPIHPEYWITDDEWTNYTRKMALGYCASFSAIGVRVLYNMENPGVNGTDDPWIVRECPGSLIKQGIVSHGYQLNGELDLWTEWRARGLDKVYARGELAVEPNPQNGTYGNWAVSPAWSLQANAEWALTFGLAQWNLYSGFLGNATFLPTMEFFNRQAPTTELSTAAAAFVSFRDSLDTADVARFPETEFGPVNNSHGKTDQLNGTRMLRVAHSMAAYGARVDDVNEARSRKSIEQKKGNSLNDVGWHIWPGNYQKYMQQVDPAATSVGRWRVGPKDQGFGRFARSLDQESGRTAIRTALEPHFASSHRDDKGMLNVTLRVVHLDEGVGRWTLEYFAAGGGPATAMTIAGTGSGRWKVAESNVAMAPCDGQGPGFDFELRSLDRQNDVFSLMEVLVQP